MDDVKPPAPPASADTSAPSAPAERAKAEPIKFKRPAIYDTLKDHVLEANGPAAEGNHMRVHEHAELRGLRNVVEFDGTTGEFVIRPHWKVRVFLAWWKAHGVEHHSRMSPQHFEAALHEALHGRV